MFIHWFPGHMTKAIRMMQKEMGLVDSIIYVLDARAPLSCINPSFDEVIGDKPRVYVLNKGDLVDRNELVKWQKYFQDAGHSCIVTNSISKADAPMLIKTLLTVNNSIIERYKARGVRKTIRAMVIGVPNSGKSTLINSLVREKKAITGNKPGVTRGKQWVSIDPYIDLLDSPGVLYPDFNNQEKAIKLALIGSIRDDILDVVELAVHGLDLLKIDYPYQLTSRYNLENVDTTGAELLNMIGKKRGMIVRGGEIDIERSAKAFLNDFRKGLIGKIILEKADDYVEARA